MGLIFFLILLHFYIVNLSARHFLNIGGIKALPSPPPNFLRGTIPPVPLSLRPCQTAFGSQALTCPTEKGQREIKRKEPEETKRD